jgi:hypothetical protein
MAGILPTATWNVYGESRMGLNGGEIYGIVIGCIVVFFIILRSILKQMGRRMNTTHTRNRTQRVPRTPANWNAIQTYWGKMNAAITKKVKTDPNGTVIKTFVTNYSMLPTPPKGITKPAP